MVNLSYKILSFLVLAIVAIHAIVPHTHHSDLSGDEHTIQHQEASSVFDYIILAFHNEQQGGELEEFVNGDSDELFEGSNMQTITILYALFIPSAEQKIKISYIVNDIPIRDNLFTTSYTLRGPPSKS